MAVSEPLALVRNALGEPAVDVVADTNPCRLFGLS
jgi:hypothetical protein